MLKFSIFSIAFIFQVSYHPMFFSLFIPCQKHLARIAMKNILLKCPSHLQENVFVKVCSSKVAGHEKRPYWKLRKYPWWIVLGVNLYQNTKHPLSAYTGQAQYGKYAYEECGIFWYFQNSISSFLKYQFWLIIYIQGKTSTAQVRISTFCCYINPFSSKLFGNISIFSRKLKLFLFFCFSFGL